MARWIVSTRQAVKNEEFRELLEGMESNITVPSRHTIRYRVLALEDKYLVEVRSILPDTTNKVALKAGAWSYQR